MGRRNSIALSLLARENTSMETGASILPKSGYKIGRNPPTVKFLQVYDPLPYRYQIRLHPPTSGFSYRICLVS